jgi:hypothetical protein
MAAKKRKKIKVQDLKPKKDAKGGFVGTVSQGSQKQGYNIQGSTQGPNLGK